MTYKGSWIISRFITLQSGIFFSSSLADSHSQFFLLLNRLPSISNHASLVQFFALTHMILEAPGIPGSQICGCNKIMQPLYQGKMSSYITLSLLLQLDESTPLSYSVITQVVKGSLISCLKIFFNLGISDAEHSVIIRAFCTGSFFKVFFSF